MSIIDLIWFSNNLKHFYIFNYLKTCLIRLHISSFCDFVTSPWKIQHLSCICYLVIPADGANLRIPWLLQEFWEIRRSLNPSGFRSKPRRNSQTAMICWQHAAWWKCPHARVCVQFHVNLVHTFGTRTSGDVGTLKDVKIFTLIWGKLSDSDHMLTCCCLVKMSAL